MHRVRRTVLGIGVLLAVLAGGATLASAAAPDQRPATVGEDDDQAREDADEVAIGGEALARASAAALAYTGGGRVTDTEVGDEDSYYEVEVRRDDGRQVDVQLDRGFTVVGAEGERDD